MYRKYSFGLTLFLMLCSNLSAAEQRSISILAAVSCEEWLSDRAEKNSMTLGEVSIKDYTSEFWLLGLITGLNANYPSSKDLLSNVNSSLIFDWMDKYCKANSNHSVYRGADLLLDEISKIK